ncbi:YegP family protein [Actinoplanes sp. NPDC051633]|uniref:YegP family protein n=1 Tax=Actinoplanes sp. NPDC051633 TaxID=3155670 RepID=UPI003449D17B
MPGTPQEFRFDLVASNGQVVATGSWLLASVRPRASGLNTIATIQQDAGSASIDDHTGA